jgi:hypothetical protein
MLPGHAYVHAMSDKPTSTRLVNRLSPRPAGRMLALAVGLGALAALIVAPVASALTWQAAATLSAPGELTQDEPSAAMDAAGDAVVAWASTNSSAYSCPCAVRVAERSAGASFGSPATLATSTEQGAEGIYGVQAAMDASGEAIVVWDAWHEKPLGPITGIIDEVYAAVRPAGGSFGAPQLLSVEGSEADGGGAPRVAMDSAGDATVAWISGLGWFSTDPEPQMQVARRPAGGSFSAPQAQASWGSGEAGPWEFRLATSPDGHTAIAYTYEEPAGCTPAPCDPLENGGKEQIRVATASPGAAFGTPAEVSPKVDNAGVGEGPAEEVRSVAIDDHADAVASYEEAGSGSIISDTRRDETVTSDGGGAFSAPVSLGAGERSYPEDVAIGPGGEATDIWVDEAGLSGAWRSPGGSFSAAQILSAEAWQGALADGSNLAGASGDVLAGLLLENGSGGQRVAASLRSPGGSFEAPTTLEQVPAGTYDAYSLGGAIDANGDAAVVAWADYQGANAFEEAPGAIRAALAGAVGSGGTQGPTPTPVPKPKPHKPLKCKKGTKKKKVHGKTRCVKKKHHRKKKHHGKKGRHRKRRGGAR